jgi:hypothetical protein
MVVEKEEVHLVEAVKVDMETVKVVAVKTAIALVEIVKVEVVLAEIVTEFNVSAVSSQEKDVAKAQQVDVALAMPTWFVCF